MPDGGPGCNAVIRTAVWLPVLWLGAGWQLEEWGALGTLCGDWDSHAERCHRTATQWIVYAQQYALLRTEEGPSQRPCDVRCRPMHQGRKVKRAVQTTALANGEALLCLGLQLELSSFQSPPHTPLCSRSGVCQGKAAA
ncbi:hypothetical protein NDU88_011305 [Pleurodeles waltl]|uniref:Uncharacterized protein n=1 Tax=Pleurodeles waltl TaxID=8319 RepID=A0AAV7QY88_PLEWA|nr:hypothetical protein NDU88_011305 [Pleurodeles waltl]